MFVLGACSSNNSTTETSTTLIPSQTSGQVSTTIQTGRVEDLVKVLWQVDTAGNAVSVLPESGDIGLAWQNVTNDGGSFKANIVRDQVAESTDAFGQSAIANGGGAWKRMYEVRRAIAGQESGEGVSAGYVTISVAVIRRTGDVTAVRRAGEAGIPPGSAAIAVSGAPVGSYAVAWNSTDGYSNAYVDSVNNAVVVRCEVRSESREAVSVCGAVNAYVLERLGDSYIG
jgi:hypothetical protein